MPVATPPITALEGSLLVRLAQPSVNDVLGV